MDNGVKQKPSQEFSESMVTNRFIDIYFALKIEQNADVYFIKFTVGLLFNFEMTLEIDNLGVAHLKLKKRVKTRKSLV